MDPAYAAILKKKCPPNSPQSTSSVLFDVSRGGQFFDKVYYRNVLAGRVAFHSDSALLEDPAARHLVKSYAAKPSPYFYEEFGKAMVKLSQLKVLTGTEGQVRKVCSRVN